ETILTRGPRRAGYPTELWPLARVAQVIRREFGIRYHPSQVWRLLTARGWQRQRLELSETEQRTLERMLVRGPRRTGPTLDRWTFERLVEWYRQEHRIYDASQIRQLLTAHGWTCPPPDRRAEATTLKTWPRGKTRYTWRLFHRPC